MKDDSKLAIQAKMCEFALTELVRQHRNSFEPLWTIDSWAKLLIWLALNCGLSGEQKSLQLFADSLGFQLISRMRRIFFERTLENLEMKLMADPAEKHAFVMSLQPGHMVTNDQVQIALETVGLDQMVVLDRRSWQIVEGLVAVPWFLQCKTELSGNAI